MNILVTGATGKVGQKFLEQISCSELMKKTKTKTNRKRKRDKKTKMKIFSEIPIKKPKLTEQELKKKVLINLSMSIEFFL